MFPIQIVYKLDTETYDYLGVVEAVKSRRGKYYCRLMFFDDWEQHYDIDSDEIKHEDERWGWALRTIFGYITETLLADEEDRMYAWYMTHKDEFKGITMTHRLCHNIRNEPFDSYDINIDHTKSSLKELNLLLQCARGYVRIGFGG